jgi:hypothetical protein
MYYMNTKSLAAIGVVAIVATLVVATFAVAGQNAFARSNVIQLQNQRFGCHDTCAGIQQQSNDGDKNNEVSGGFNIASRGGSTGGEDHH